VDAVAAALRPAALRARWRGLGRGERVALAGLVLLLAAGIAVRVVAMYGYRPAFIGYPDTREYALGAGGDLWADPFRTVGYPFFLRVLHVFSDHLSLVVAVQHLLGVATALLLFGAVRRAGGPAWLGLVPAAVVLLGGDHVLFEHAVLTETLYTFLIAAALYAGVRALEGGSTLGWPAAAGLLLGLAATVRIAGLVLVPLLAAWMLLVPAARGRERALRTGVAATAGGLVLLGYLVAAHAETDRWSFARTGAYNFYGRVSSFADCDEFDEPRGTEVLCDDTPPHQRRAPQWFIFTGPAATELGYPENEVPEETVDRIRTFSRRAALAQPLDWLDAAARDFARYVAPDEFGRPSNTPTARDYRRLLVHPVGIPTNYHEVDAYWTIPGVRHRAGLFDFLEDYENVTAVEGVPMAVFLVLTLAGPVALRGRERHAALLLGGMALAILVVPVATINYDGRLGVPAYGPLAAAAALGGWGIARRARARLRSSRS
jgi:4-amino-4-deoxy-L-arabinose transferase-like glycosyltransferase